MTRRAHIRRVVAKLHLWLGLTIGLVWALQGATGALLVFHRDLDHAWGVHGRGGAPASLDRIVSAGGGVNQVLRVGIRDTAGDVLAVDRIDERTVLVDASSANVLAVRETEPSGPRGGNGWRWLYRLHEALLLGDTGETLIGISGLFLLSAALTGLWLGWPRPLFRSSRWRAVFDVRRWQSAAQRLYGWHRAAGLLVALGFVVMTVTGAWMAFAADVRPWLARHVAYQMPTKPPLGSLNVAISPQAALTIAQRQFPNARFVRATLPTNKAAAYTIRLRQPGESRAWSGTTSVTVNAADGRVLGRYDPLTAPLANRLADAAFALHTGEIAGLPSRLLVLAAGLSLPLLYLTGILGWLGRRRRRIANCAKARR